MSSSHNPSEAPFFASAGIDVPPVQPRDPYQALDDLMVVVEALCTRWPDRGTFVDGGRMLL